MLDCITVNSRRQLHVAKRRMGSRSVWQRGFVSVTIDKEWAFNQKLEYINHNPVQRGLCELPCQYRWSTALFWEKGCWDGEELVLSKEVIEFQWPRAIRDTLSEVVGHRNATDGTVAQ
jgi:hypothetical protein